MGAESQAIATIPALLEAATRYVEASRAPATRRAYASAWRTFGAWCAGHKRRALPARGATVALYVSDLAARGRALATIQLALAAIGEAHAAAGRRSPCRRAEVRAVLRGIRRTHGTAARQKHAVTVGELRAMVAPRPREGLQIPDGRELLERAVLLVGFAAALRRSEVAALDLADVEQRADGAVLTIRRSKTDQVAAGRQVWVPRGAGELTCPVRALAAWLERRGEVPGPLFSAVVRGAATGRRLCGRTVARVVQRAARRLGLTVSEFGGHSLRAGLATAAARAGKSERAIAEKTGHRSVQTLRRYIRAGVLGIDDAADGIGL